MSQPSQGPRSLPEPGSQPPMPAPSLPPVPDDDFDDDEDEQEEGDGDQGEDDDQPPDDGSDRAPRACLATNLTPLGLPRQP